MLRITAHSNPGSLTFRPEKRSATMYQVSVYPITPNLWRWEIRCGGALLRWAPPRPGIRRVVN